MLNRLIREPLAHFLGLALLIFAAYAALDRQGFSSRERIDVSAARIEQLAGLFAKTWQRPPAPAELKGLIDDYVAEEIYYRQGKLLGLDADDTVIRRRLRLKMELIDDAGVDRLQPGEGELARHLAANAERFAIEPQFAFDQVFLSPERHGDRLEAEAAVVLAGLRGGGIADFGAAGDRTLLPPSLPLSARSIVARDFGDDFAGAIAGLPVGSWAGPVRSAYGLHLVRIGARRDGRAPPLAEVRALVEREWKAERRQEVRRQRLAELAEYYDIVIETQGGGAAGSDP